MVWDDSCDWNSETQIYALLQYMAVTANFSHANYEMIKRSIETW